jgi:hypothetical protein
MDSDATGKGAPRRKDWSVATRLVHFYPRINHQKGTVPVVLVDCSSSRIGTQEKGSPSLNGLVWHVVIFWRLDWLLGIPCVWCVLFVVN